MALKYKLEGLLSNFHMFPAINNFDGYCVSRHTSILNIKYALLQEDTCTLNMRLSTWTEVLL